MALRTKAEWADECQRLMKRVEELEDEVEALHLELQEAEERD